MEELNNRERLLTTGEISQYCQVTHRAVLKWVDSGKLKAYRTPGKHSRVSLENFIAFLEYYQMPIPEDLKASLKQKRVLIVDDDRGMVHSLQRVFMMSNKFVIETAYDGFDAGKKFVIFKPDFVVLDLNMPGLDGFEVCANIRCDPKNQYVKILVISGTNDPLEIKRIKDLGANDYLEKPFSNEVLQGKIKNMLG